MSEKKEQLHDVHVKFILNLLLHGQDVFSGERKIALNQLDIMMPRIALQVAMTMLMFIEMLALVHDNGTHLTKKLLFAMFSP